MDTNNSWQDALAEKGKGVRTNILTISCYYRNRSKNIEKKKILKYI